MANRNWASGGKTYSMHKEVVLINATCTVTPTNVKGISNLKGPTVQNIYMHSTAGTPSGPDPVAPTVTPASGTIVIQLQDNYNQLLSHRASIVSPSSGSDVKIDNSAMTAGVAYTITTLGDATLAKWRAIGVPRGITPAVGVSFIAATNGGAGNVLTSMVQATAAAGSGIASIEMVPLQNSDIAPAPSQNQGFGAQFILQCRDYAGAIAAPATGSQINIELYLSNSSVIMNSTQASE